MFEWLTEQDFYEFTAHGFPCRIVRNHLGNLCGYVGVPKENELFGKNYTHEIYLPQSAYQEDTKVSPLAILLSTQSEPGKGEISAALNVHGGISYSDSYAPMEEEYPAPAGYWWFGFDCGHHNDVIPQFIEKFGFDPMPGQTYKNVAFVRAECDALAEILERYMP